MRSVNLLQGPRYVVQLGEKTVDYNEDFRLFMTTRNPHPTIPPDTASIISEVDFTTTRAGLKGQVSSEIVSCDAFITQFYRPCEFSQQAARFSLWPIMCCQLLALTIQHEKPELEQRKTQLLREEEELKIKLSKLEESLLEVRDAIRW